MMLKKWIILLLTSVSLLAACHSPVFNQTEANVADVKLKAVAARAKSNNDAKPLPPLVMKPGLYVDTTPISLDRQPSWLSNHIVIRGDKLPFSFYSRTIAAGAGNNILAKYQTGLDQNVILTLNYTGTVKGALDLLAAKTGYSYIVHTNSVFWQAFVTRTFDVAFMPGSSDYLMGKKSGGGTTTAQGGNNTGSVSNYVSSDSSDDEFSNLRGTLSIWDDLNTTIKQLLSPDGKVMVSQSTTTVTVRDRPTNVSLISQYIHNLNQNLAKQVLVKVQVLEVQLQNDFTFGIDWAVITNAFSNSPFKINANYGTPVSITSLTPQSGGLLPGNVPAALPTFGTFGDPTKVPSYTILLNALNQQGKTSIVSEPRAVCLNNQVSVIRIVTSEGYIASIQNTTLAGSTVAAANNTVTSQVTPGTVITGLTLYVLPKILGKNVYLQVNADLSNNLGFKTFPGSNQIQLPNITTKHFNQRSMIRSGDTLILSGFRQVKNVANANQFINSQALGGKGSSQVNTETIVLITPIILHGNA